MEENKITTNFGIEIASWQVPEYEKHERSKAWYVAAIIVALGLLLFAYLSANFLFAVIIIVGALVTLLHDGQNPDMVQVTLTTEGVVVGRKFYDYDEISNFSVLYKPNAGIRKLYFEFKNTMRPRLSISLADLNPLPIRENLLKYLPEDLERVNEPLSEILAQLFKL